MLTPSALLGRSVGLLSGQQVLPSSQVHIPVTVTQTSQPIFTIFNQEVLLHLFIRIQFNSGGKSSITILPPLGVQILMGGNPCL
jgi:hypothetical protein